MPRDIQPPTTNERGDEVHPAFAMIRAARVTGNATLFDSDTKHNHYVVVTIETATRQRSLNRDWIHGHRRLIEVAMSEAQWAGFVSSMNTSGVPATLTYTEADGLLPELPFEPRLAMSMQETRDAADRVFTRAREALAAYEAHKTVANLRALRAALDNAGSNVEFAAQSLSEHAENVVQKARADVEAFVTQKAIALGMDPREVGGYAITAGADE